MALLALVSDGAEACKPRFWSASEIDQSSTTIFVARITATRSDHGKQALTLTVLETLKGSLPRSIETDAGNIRAFGDGCNAIEGHHPVRNVGDVWVISGRFDEATRSFQSIGETSFPVPDSYQGDEPDQLRTLREELARNSPAVPPRHTRAAAVPASAAKHGAAKPDRILGICHLIENRRLSNGEPEISAVNGLGVIMGVRLYFRYQEKRDITGPSTAVALENPEHGELRDEGTFVMDAETRVLRDTGERNYLYIPAPGFFGKDRAVLLVEMGGLKIRVVYTFHVVDVINGNEGLCPEPFVRKISLNAGDASGGDAPVPRTIRLGG